jgi:hypothetical protein
MTIREFSKDLQKKLTPYLAYNLKFVTANKKPSETKFSLCSGLITKSNKSSFGSEQYTVISEYKIFSKNFLPVLKPFSDYVEILEITDEMNDYEIQMIEDDPNLIKRLPYDVIEKMFKHHIDVFGLINFGLAVSIHDVE